VLFYEAMPDKRGEVWAGELHGGHMLRFNPAADHWTEYVLPEPYSHDRRTWIDNSTTPVTVWYVDHNSYVVRVQARE
jgi:streptogramin lyase